MKLVCTGPMQFTPYQPWSEKRKRAARDRIAAKRSGYAEPEFMVLLRETLAWEMQEAEKALRAIDRVLELNEQITALDARIRSWYPQSVKAA